jgi:hypothetical protein
LARCVRLHQRSYEDVESDGPLSRNWQQRQRHRKVMVMGAVGSRTWRVEAALWVGRLLISKADATRAAIVEGRGADGERGAQEPSPGAWCRGSDTIRVRTTSDTSAKYGGVCAGSGANTSSGVEARVEMEAGRAWPKSWGQGSQTSGAIRHLESRAWQSPSSTIIPSCPLLTRRGAGEGLLLDGR